MKVLVTGAGALLGQGIIRALRMSSLDPEIVAADPSPLAAGLWWADRRYLIPMAAAPAYLPSLRRLLDVERPDAVLIGTDTELPLIAAEREALEAEFGTAIIVSSPDVVEIADDKWKTAVFLEEQGIPHPRSALPGSEDRLIEEVGFPVIVKPRVGARSAGVSRVSTPDELRDALYGRSDVLIQECVATLEDEFTAGVVHFEGQPLISIVMRRHLRDGNTYRAFVRDWPELNAQVRRIAGALRPYGPVNFQFGSVDGVARVFEINARFSGTTPLRARAGFNEVDLVLRHVLHGEKMVQPDLRPVNFLRYWTEVEVDPGELNQVSEP